MMSFKMMSFLQRISIQPLLLAPFLLLIVSGLTIPSDGQHGALNVKSIALLFSLIGTFFCLAVKKKVYWQQFKLITLMFCSISFLMLWFLVYMMVSGEPLSSPIDQFKIFFITLLAVSMSLYFVRENIISFELLFKTIIYANFAYSLTKVLIVLLHLLGLINIWNLMESTGIRVMTMGVYGNLTRVQTSVDIVTPFFLFFVLQSDRLNVPLGRKFKVFYLVISFISIFLSFSRFLIAIGFLSVLFYWVTLNATKKIKTIFLCLILLLLLVSYVGLETVNTIIQVRFFSIANADSDSTRTQQINALLKGYYDSPYFGRGLGGYVQENVRDTLNTHSYEVQWVAFLMQFGLVGILFLMIPVGLILSKLLNSPITKVKLAFSFLFIFWLFSGNRTHFCGYYLIYGYYC